MGFLDNDKSGGDLDDHHSTKDYQELLHFSKSIHLFHFVGAREGFVLWN